MLFISVSFMLLQSNISVAETNLLASTRSEISEYAKSLHFESYDRYDVTSLFLLNRKLLESNDLPKTKAVLQRLGQAVDWSVEPIIAVEQINVYLKNEDRSELLQFLVQIAESADASLYEEMIFRVLTEQFIEFPKEPVRKAMKKLLPVFDGWQQNPEFIIWALGYLNAEDPDYSQLVFQLWSVMNVNGFPSSFTSNLVELKKNPNTQQEIVASHFSNQYQLKNWSYIIAEAPFYLDHLSPDGDAFKKVRGVYFKSYFQKRLYSSLIQLLNSRENATVFSLTGDENAELLFRLWLKKGQLNKAAEYLKLLENSAPVETLNAKYFEIAEYLYGRNQYSSSLRYYLQIKISAASAELIEAVQWRKLRIYHLLKQHQKMVNVVGWADNFQFQSKEVAAKFCYWGVKLNLYAQESTQSCYQQYPLTYYGFRSLTLGPTKTKIEKTSLMGSTLKNETPLSPTENTFLKFVHVLYLSNEIEIADALVLRYLHKYINREFFTRLVDVLSDADRYYFQQQLADRYFGGFLQNDGNEYRPFLKASYPAGYHKKVSSHIGQSNLPQMLVYAVIREESNFRVAVKSPAGAVGLMQLMPSTAKYVAKKIRTQYDPAQLIHPDFNLKLGIAYLKQLLKRYKGNLFYTLAAYNGGATNVKRWVRKVGNGDFDVFVESITFLETQNYVKRVIRSYYIYQMLYGQKIQLDNSDFLSFVPGRMPAAAS
ncbi:MAG: lytic transglycosylase domain-containing protein [SAR324 cluster bacterium]|nr:lytic transglycosylase domain-containing protein [SAR324 cluster bacterium]